MKRSDSSANVFALSPDSRRKKRRSRTRIAPGFRELIEQRLGGLRLSFDHGDVGAVDRDAARLLLLGHDALEVEMQEAVLELGALDLDMLGELEAALERAACDALIEIARLLRLFIAALALNSQDAIAHFDVQVLIRE